MFNLFSVLNWYFFFLFCLLKNEWMFQKLKIPINLNNFISEIHNPIRQKNWKLIKQRNKKANLWNYFKVQSLKNRKVINLIDYTLYEMEFSAFLCSFRFSVSIFLSSERCLEQRELMTSYEQVLSFSHRHLREINIEK